MLYVFIYKERLKSNFYEKNSASNSIILIIYLFLILITDYFFFKREEGSKTHVVFTPID